MCVRERERGGRDGAQGMGTSNSMRAWRSFGMSMMWLMAPNCPSEAAISVESVPSGTARACTTREGGGCAWMR